MIVFLLAALLVLLAGCGGEEERQPATPSESIVGMLREGGLTLVVRHAAADAQIARQELLRSCAYQRNLTVAGREQARAAGRAIRALRIPVGEVRASPMCRARDTARLMFGRTRIDRDLISPGVIGSQADDRRRARMLRELARRPPAKGDNRALVTHTGNIGSAFREETVQEGETLLFGAVGRLVGRIGAEEWAVLARAAG